MRFMLGLFAQFLAVQMVHAGDVSQEQLLREMYKVVHGHYPPALWVSAQSRPDLPTPTPEVPTDARYFLDADSLEVQPEALSIEESCDVHKSYSRYDTLRDRLLEGFPRLLRQVSACASAYNLPNLNEAQFVLNRLKIRCYSEPDSSRVAYADPDHTRPGEEYEIMMNTQSTGIFRSDYFSEIGWSDSKLSSVVFHESLHHSANNNKAWHEQGQALKKKDREFFADRVNFTEAVCFPDTKRGRRLKKFASEFPLQFHESCLAAWMEVDPDVSPPKAIPLKTDRAEAICLRVEQGTAVLAEYGEINKPVKNPPPVSAQPYLKLFNPYTRP